MRYKFIPLIVVILLSGLGHAQLPDPIGYWPFDGDALDHSGLGNDATLEGDPEFVDGFVGQAIFLDGDDYVRMDGVADDVVNNDITMSAWVKTTDTGDWFSVNTGTGGNVALFATENQRAAMYDSGYEGHSTTIVTDGEWHMLTYVRQGDTGYISVDGVQENSHEANFTFSADDRWSLGQEWDTDIPSDFLIGTIDEVYVYSVGLTEAEVAELFNSAAASPAAWNPSPDDEASEVATDADLSWAPGIGAVSHDVYLGVKKADVASGAGDTFQGNQAETSFDPGTLLPGATYYWRIDEVDAAGTTTAGEVWSFTTVDYLVLDDFESYTDFEPDRIFDVWLDGWKIDTNGSEVGNVEAPFAEQEIVYGGLQSMNVAYDNSGTAAISTVERTFEPPMDLTVQGLEGLTLWYHGQPGAVGGLSYDAASQSYTITGNGADIGESSDQFHFAHKPLNGDGTIIARIDSIENTNAWAKAGVMIRETMDPDSVHAMVAVTPSGRVAFVFRPGTAGGSQVTSTAQDSVSLPHWVKLTRQGARFSAEHSADGVNWMPVESSDPQDPSQFNIPMVANVSVGLAVTAHRTDGTPCAAVLSNVSVAGAAAGPFAESVDVGISSNDPGQLYLGLEDAAGTLGIVDHWAGPEAILTDDWQLWSVALEQVGALGVDLSAISKILIGIGDRATLLPGGSGVVYFDDIRAVLRLPTAGMVLLFEEDFDGLTLGASVDEEIPGDDVWTKTPPPGWAIDDSGVPGAGDPANDGVTEWAGWSFASQAWWVETAEDQERSAFTLGSGTVALVDPDEWDDLDHAEGLLNSFLSTPAIEVSGMQAGEGMLQLTFDSSWRQEDTQTANVTVQFDEGDPIEVLRWESAGGDPALLKADATNETVTVRIDRPAGAKKMVVTFGMLDAGNDWWWAIDNIQVRGVPRERLVVLSEDFEGLPLGPNVDEAVAGDAVWTKTGPEGWTFDDSGVPSLDDPAHGVTEWAGWSFADNDWWASVDDQRRSEFELAVGAIAVADSDEYDDKGDPVGMYSTFMSTPAIDISGVEAGSVELKFDSSWRPESAQTANITVSYDGGAPVEVLRWESDAGSVNFKNDDSTSETIVVDLRNPAGVKNVVVTFGYFNASNNWWWAIDNVEVSGIPREKIPVFTEDFEGLPLGPNVDESVPGDAVWTKTAPEGWTLDDSGVPGIDDPDQGVAEWAGWSFADNDWWASVDDQRRSEFELAVGTAAIADSDEYDDKGDPVGTYNAFMSTPAIDVSGVEAGSLELIFDSSWRPESSQTANITASYDGGAAVEVMRWESDGASPLYHDHNTNETVTIALDNPDGAQSLVLTFGYFDASNNWWWAIDNVVVQGTPKPSVVRVFAESFEGLALEPALDEAPPGVWTKTGPEGWNVEDGFMPGIGDPATDGVTEWAGWSFADKDWWVQVAGDQERSQFVLGTGTVAIADPDEWDDAAHPDGSFMAFLDTPAISLAGIDAGSLELTFDSSWRPYASQTAVVSVSYDGGDWVDVLLWESDPASANFKTDTTNETVTVSIDNPAGATDVIVSFGLFDAGNDWWWAIDNVSLTGTSGAAPVDLLSEDFEGLPLGPGVDEVPPPPKVWTKSGPEGWLIDDSGVPGAGDPDNDGVTEWAGWSFANKDWWVQVAEDQDRSLFTLGTGTVMVADPDEWDDVDDPAQGESAGLYNTFVSTPVIDVTEADPRTLRLTFDSSWRREDTQTATVLVSFDGAPPTEILRWESEGGDPAFLKDDATNETVTLDLNGPAGAQTLVVTFGMLDAGNDWWWAIDNVEITGAPAQ